MKITYGALLAFILSVFSCKNGDSGKPESGQNDEKVTVFGIVNDGYYKRYPFFVEAKGESYGLDVVNIETDRLGKSYEVSGNVITRHGIKIITNVFINGIRYQTPQEWKGSIDSPSPFESLGED